jgi:hypothetical protein
MTNNACSSNKKTAINELGYFLGGKIMMATLRYFYYFRKPGL